MMNGLDSKVVLITGAARGSGAATARLLAENGAHVVLADVRDGEGEHTAKEIGGTARYVHLDVTDEWQWEDVVATLSRDFGKLDGLVNNAAVLHLAPIWATSTEDYLRVVRVNELGVFLGVRAVIKPMRDAGGGSIVNVSSIDGVYAAGTTVAYSATKFAVRGITKVAAVELGRYGIRVNCVCPAAGNPEMVRELLPAGVEPTSGSHFTLPIGRSGELRDVANAVKFLLSDESSFFTGADFVMDGGLTAGVVVDSSDPV
jgi:3alpha(or 20beta)-hydroxysteroid dehydrogenase